MNHRINDTSCKPTGQHHPLHSANKQSSSLQAWITHRKCPKRTKLDDRELTNSPLMCMCVCMYVHVQTLSFGWHIHFMEKHIFDRWTNTNILDALDIFTLTREKLLYSIFWSKCWNYTLSWHHVRRFNPPKLQLVTMHHANTGANSRKCLQWQ